MGILVIARSINPRPHYQARGALTSYAGVITSPRSKYMVSGYQPKRADNRRAGNIVSHIQTLGYRG